MDHRDYPSSRFRFERKGELPLEFEGWRVASCSNFADPQRPRSGESELAVFETVGGVWVTRRSVHDGYGGGEHVTTTHPSRDDAVAVLGFSSQAMMIREILGYPMVERLA